MIHWRCGRPENAHVAVHPGLEPPRIVELAAVNRLLRTTSGTVLPGAATARRSTVTTAAGTRPTSGHGARLMHHHLDKLAGVRLRSDVNDEIASENRAISHIEEAIDNYVPPTCSFCTAWAMDWCSLCDRPFCEADFVADGLCRECDAELLS